jgi:hypothetical protein
LANLSTPPLYVAVSIPSNRGESFVLPASV